jgi:hypothetical protein
MKTINLPNTKNRKSKLSNLEMKNYFPSPSYEKIDRSPTKSIDEIGIKNL